MRCRLCNEERELADSHIISEFLYKPTYREKHRAKQIELPACKTRHIQKGHREELLCFECEQRFSKYERYFSQIWYGNQAKRPSAVHPPGVAIQGLDYARFKLFHLSVLWRAAISSRDEYQAVRLGIHERRIADLLLRGDPSSDDQYPIGAFALVDRNTDKCLEGLIVSPVVRKSEGQTTYIFVFGGCAWLYGVSSHWVRWFPRSLREDGTLTVPSMPFDEFPVMADLMGMLGKALFVGPSI
jgi:hypothetical protein